MQEKIIPPHVPFQCEILRETNSDGKTTYRHLYADSEIQTHEEELFELISEALNRVEGLLQFLSDDGYGNYGYMIELLMEDTRRRLAEAEQFVEEAVGKIICQQVTRGTIAYRTGRVLGITVDPARKGTK